MLARAERKKSCPTCDRPFPTESDFSNLIEKLRSRAEKVQRGNVYPRIVQSRKNAEEELEQLRNKQSHLNEYVYIGIVRLVFFGETYSCLYRLESIRKIWNNLVETKTKKQQEYREWEEKIEKWRQDLHVKRKNKDSISNIYSLLQKRQSLVDDWKRIENEVTQMVTRHCVYPCTLIAYG